MSLPLSRSVSACSKALGSSLSRCAIDVQRVSARSRRAHAGLGGLPARADPAALRGRGARLVPLVRKGPRAQLARQEPPAQLVSPEAPVLSASPAQPEPKAKKGA